MQVAYTHKDLGLVFFCPACQCGHYVKIDPSSSPCWTWNNDLHNPSIEPSVLTVHVRLTEKGRKEAERAASLPKGHVLDHQEVRCHLFVKNGFIQYLDDCTHAFAGKTVKMHGV